MPPTTAQRTPSKKQLVEYSEKHFKGAAIREWTEEMWLRFCKDNNLGNWRKWRREIK